MSDQTIETMAEEFRAALGEGKLPEDYSKCMLNPTKWADTIAAYHHPLHEGDGVKTSAQFIEFERDAQQRFRQTFRDYRFAESDVKVEGSQILIREVMALTTPKGIHVRATNNITLSLENDKIVRIDIAYNPDDLKPVFEAQAERDAS